MIELPGFAERFVYTLTSLIRPQYIMQIPYKQLATNTEF